MKTAEIIAIGDELLSGETVDTNSSYLDAVLEGWGYRVLRHTTVLDDIDAIASVYTEAARRADLVVSTGGLGPTLDDLTLEGLAKALGCGLVEHAETLERIRRMFEAIGREMTPNNRRQAMVPERGEVVPNDSGTAPSFLAELSGAKVFLMPGVPREVRWLVEHQLAHRVERSPPAFVRRTVKVIGMGESKLEDTITAVVNGHPEVRFGYRTQGIENHVKLFAEGADAAAKLDRAEAGLREVLGDLVYGRDAETFEGALLDLLTRAKVTVATAESCTGGLVAKLLTDVSGSSAYVIGGVVTYANAAKVELCEVSAADLEAHGAVSEVVAKAMASGVRARLGSDFAVSTTGVAGPSGGSAEKPVGTVWIGIAGPGGVSADLVRLPGRSREWIREMAAKAALGRLRLELLRWTRERPP